MKNEYEDVQKRIAVQNPSSFVVVRHRASEPEEQQEDDKEERVVSQVILVSP